MPRKSKGAENKYAAQESEFNRLCSEYRALPSDDTEARKHKFEEMYPLAEFLAAPIVAQYTNNRNGAYADRMESVPGEVLMKLVGWPNTDPKTFAPFFKASVDNKLRDISRQMRTHQRHEKDMTSVRAAGRRDTDADSGRWDMKQLGRHDDSQDDISLLKETAARMFGTIGIDKLEIFLDWMDDMKYTEIAAKHRVPLGTVKSRLDSVKKALQQIPALCELKEEASSLSVPEAGEFYDTMLDVMREMVAKKRSSGQNIAG